MVLYKIIYDNPFVYYLKVVYKKSNQFSIRYTSLSSNETDIVLTNYENIFSDGKSILILSKNFWITIKIINYLD